MPPRYFQAVRDQQTQFNALNPTDQARQRALQSGDPNNVLAQVMQGYWKDYKTTGLPLFDDLAGETTYGANGQAVLDREVQSGVSRANTAIEVSGQNQQERLRGYGISLSPEQEADNQRLNSLSKSTALTDTANRITANLIDRNRAIATGGATQTIYRDQLQKG